MNFTKTAEAKKRDVLSIQVYRLGAHDYNERCWALSLPSFAAARLSLCTRAA
jgi:hypothetical protein